MKKIVKAPDVVEVDYHFKRGMHVFTSFTADGLLHVDSKDREEAYSRIAPVLSRLVSFACGQTVRYVPTADYKEFVAFLSGEATSEGHNLSFVLEKEPAHA